MLHPRPCAETWWVATWKPRPECERALQTDQAAIHSQIKKPSLSNFCATKKKFEVFPELTGYKARHIKYLIPCMVEITKDFLSDDDPYTLHRQQCLCHLQDMYGMMDSCGLHMGKLTSKNFKQSIDLCLLHFAKCAKQTINQGYVQWNTIHKHHLVAHMASQAAFLNPRIVSTYSGETMVGYMSSLAHSCCNGTPPHLVPEKVL